MQISGDVLSRTFATDMKSSKCDLQSRCRRFESLVADTGYAGSQVPTLILIQQILEVFTGDNRENKGNFTVFPRSSNKFRIQAGRCHL